MGIGRVTLILYGLLMGLGGIMGYAAKKSIYSLISGLVTCAALIGAFYWAKTQPKNAVIVGLAFAVGWALFFLKAVLGGKRMPEMGISAVSALAAIFFLIALYKSS